MENCQIEKFRGCCCACKNQVEIKKHPWNKSDGKGRISETMGYGCSCPDLTDGEKLPQIIFFDENHGMCEMYQAK